VKYRRGAESIAVVAAALAGLTAWVWPTPGHGEPLVALVAHTPARAQRVTTADAPSPTSEPASEPAPEVVAWQPSHGRECGRHKRGRPYCQGPRRVPVPQGPDADRAKELGLGELKTASHLLLNGPDPKWLAAAGDASEPALLWPIDDGVLWRGLQGARNARGRWHPRHKGLDIGAAVGTQIHAVQSGLVAYADNGVRGYGNLLLVVHPDGSVAFYGHCSEIRVFAGQHVTRGQVVGNVGETGMARGPHLHFELRRNGSPTNPLPHFEK